MLMGRRPAGVRHVSRTYRRAGPDDADDPDPGRRRRVDTRFLDGRSSARVAAMWIRARRTSWRACRPASISTPAARPGPRRSGQGFRRIRERARDMDGFPARGETGAYAGKPDLNAYYIGGYWTQHRTERVGTWTRLLAGTRYEQRPNRATTSAPRPRVGRDRVGGRRVTRCPSARNGISSRRRNCVPAPDRVQRRGRCVVSIVPHARQRDGAPGRACRVSMRTTRRNCGRSWKSPCCATSRVPTR